MSIAKSLSNITSAIEFKLTEEESLLIYEKLKYDALDGNIEKVKFSLDKFGFGNIFIAKGYVEEDKFLEKTANLFNLLEPPIVQLLMDELIKSKYLDNILYAYVNHKKPILENIIFSKDNPQALMAFLNAVEKYNPSVKKENQTYFNNLNDSTFILDRVIHYVCPNIFNILSQSQEFINDLAKPSLQSLLNSQTQQYLTDEAKLSSFIEKEKVKLEILEKTLNFSPEINQHINTGLVNKIQQLMYKHKISHLAHNYYYAKDYFHVLFINGALSLDETFQHDHQKSTFKQLFDLGQKELSELEKAILEKNTTHSNSSKKLKI
jgi:hypothetical protein